MINISAVMSVVIMIWSLLLLIKVFWGAIKAFYDVTKKFLARVKESSRSADKMGRIR